MNDSIFTSLFNQYEISNKLIDLILKNGTIKEFTPSETFLHEGQSDYSFAYLIVKGSIEVYLDSIVKKTLLYTHRHTELSILANYNNLFNNQPVNLSYISIDHSIIVSLPLDLILTWSNQYPIILQAYLKSQQNHCDSILNLIKSYHKITLKSRMFNYLKQKSFYFKSNEITLPHQQIANDLNCSRETVSRYLKDFEQKNILKRNIRSITLL